MINCVTGITGIVSAGVVVGLLHPVLLVLLASQYNSVPDLIRAD